MLRSPVGDVMRAEADADILWLEEDFVAPGSAFTSGSGSLRTAERLAQVANILTVDEAHAGLDCCGNTVRAPDVLAPHVAAQSVLNVVGLGDGVLLIVKGNQAGDR